MQSLGRGAAGPGEFSKLVPHTGYYAIPLANLWLPEQPGARVPRAIGALAQPAPILDMGQQQPQRLAHCAGEMRHCRIDCDDQVEFADRGRGFGEVGQRILYPQDRQAIEDRQIGVPIFTLQADELHGCERQQWSRRDNAMLRL